MFCIKGFRLLLMKHSNLSKNITFHRHRVSGKFYEEILGFSSTKVANRFLKNRVYLKELDADAVSESVRYLKEIGIHSEHIQEQPNILCTSRIVLQNQHEILSECGCITGNVNVLHRYNEIVNYTENDLKNLKILDNNINLQKRLASRLNVKFDACKGDARLGAIRRHFLRLFLVDHGLMTAEESDEAIRQNNVRHTSYRTTEKILYTLTQQFRIPKNKIGHYRLALKADPDQLQKLLEIKQIGGVSFDDILRKKPALMLESTDTILKTVNELKSVGVNEEIAVQRLDELYKLIKLGPTMVRNRLIEMKKQLHFDVMKFHPMFLKLIVHNSKAYYRKDILEQVDKKCFNVESLTGASYPFRRYVQTIEDKHLQKDCILFLTSYLGMDAQKVRDEMSRHPYWLNIPLVDVQLTIDKLKVAGFQLEDIRENLHIVLYSMHLILSRYKKLNEQFEENLWERVPKTVQLKLILYDIELETHFTGEGVWMDRKSEDQECSDSSV